MPALPAKCVLQSGTETHEAELSAPWRDLFSSAVSSDILPACRSSTRFPQGEPQTPGCMPAMQELPAGRIPRA